MENNKVLYQYNIITPYLTKECSLSKIARKNKINIRTLQRWVKKYKIQGFKSLERKKRRDYGVHRKITSTVKKAIEGLALDKENMSIATITRIVNEFCVEQKRNPIGYYTVRKIVQDFPNDMRILAQEGDKSYADKYEMVMRRTSKYPNQIWQIDHSLLDLIVIDDENNKKKPWLTIVIDDFSRAISGFSLFIGAPSALQTGLALHKAIWYKEDEAWLVCGIPEILYTDHGTDFTSTHISQVCTDLKINLINSIVGKPQGRGKIERFFLSLDQKLLSMLRIQKKVYSLTKLEEIIKNFIVNDYHYSIHGTTKENPIDSWNKSKLIPQMPESVEKLSGLLLTPKKSRIVQRDGIRFSGLRYYHPNLVAYVGESIIIRFNPADLAEIWVYEQDKLICKAVCEELQNSLTRYEELKKIRTKRKKELKREIKSKLSVAEELFQKKVAKVKSSPSKTQKSKFRRYKNE